MNMKSYSCGLILLLVVMTGCFPSKELSGSKKLGKNETQLRLVDSIIGLGLDNEALYTLVSDIKPMSSLANFSYPFYTSDTALLLSGNIVDLSNNKVAISDLETIVEVLRKLDIKGLEFAMVPFRYGHDSLRMMQLNVIRKHSLDKVIARYQEFFGYMGIVPGTDPSVVLSTVENQDQLIRLRGYGYLFGYPKYAVDFFVESYFKESQTGNFVERDFFQIPAYTGERGRFVYAIPKNHRPSDVDSSLYYKSVGILNNYKSRRGDYMRKDSTLRALDLVRDFSMK